jgi:hypothetical protein
MSSHGATGPSTICVPSEVRPVTLAARDHEGLAGLHVATPDRESRRAVRAHAQAERVRTAVRPGRRAAAGLTARLAGGREVDDRRDADRSQLLLQAIGVAQAVDLDVHAAVGLAFDREGGRGRAAAAGDHHRRRGRRRHRGGADEQPRGAPRALGDGGRGGGRGACRDDRAQLAQQTVFEGRGAHEASRG